MKQHKHLFSNPPGNGHWRLNQTSQGLKFSVIERDNRAEFVSFELIMEEDGKSKCILAVTDNDQLKESSKGIGEEIVDKTGFFKSFKLGSSLYAKHDYTGYYLETENIDTAELMLYYADRKLQFTQEHYSEANNFILAMRMGAAVLTADETRSGCALL